MTDWIRSTCYPFIRGKKIFCSCSSKTRFFDKIANNQIAILIEFKFEINLDLSADANLIKIYIMLPTDPSQFLLNDYEVAIWNISYNKFFYLDDWDRVKKSIKNHQIFLKVKIEFYDMISMIVRDFRPRLEKAMRERETLFCGL